MDVATQRASKGNFAQVCVEIDLSKPLKARYRFRGRIQKIQYEGMHNLCFHCGKYGHRMPECPLSTTNGNGEHSTTPTASTTTQGACENKSMDHRQKDDAQEAKYGDWMIARRNRRRAINSSGDRYTSRSAQQSLQMNSNRGSRFNLLQNATENNIEDHGRLALTPAKSQGKTPPARILAGEAVRITQEAVRGKTRKEMERSRHSLDDVAPGMQENVATNNKAVASQGEAVIKDMAQPASVRGFDAGQASCTINEEKMITEAEEARSFSKWKDKVFQIERVEERNLLEGGDKLQGHPMGFKPTNEISTRLDTKVKGNDLGRLNTSGRIKNQDIEVSHGPTNGFASKTEQLGVHTRPPDPYLSPLTKRDPQSEKSNSSTSHVVSEVADQRTLGEIVSTKPSKDEVMQEDRQLEDQSDDDDDPSNTNLC